MSRYHLHIGVYGLLENGKEILLIRKSRGPYKGLFDLPGGSPNHGEPLLTALKREIQEETGIEATAFSSFGNFSFLVPYQDNELTHIALIYRVNQFDAQNFDPSIIDQDVKGSLWVNRQSLCPDECSPLVRKVLET